MELMVAVAVRAVEKRIIVDRLSLTHRPVLLNKRPGISELDRVPAKSRSVCIIPPVLNHDFRLRLLKRLVQRSERSLDSLGRRTALTSSHITLTGFQKTFHRWG